MAVYVDQLRPCERNRNWRWDESCHLFADSISELHEFARRLGLKREWFQDAKGFRHYDLNAKRRAKAVEMGATEVSGRFLVEHARAERAGLRRPSREQAGNLARELGADQVIIIAVRRHPPAFGYSAFGTGPMEQQRAGLFADHAVEAIRDHQAGVEAFLEDQNGE